MEITTSPANLLLNLLLLIITLALSLYFLYPLYDFFKKRRQHQPPKYKTLRIWLSSLIGVLFLLYSINEIDVVFTLFQYLHN